MSAVKQYVRRGSKLPFKMTVNLRETGKLSEQSKNEQKMVMKGSPEVLHFLGKLCLYTPFPVMTRVTIFRTWTYN